MRCTKCGSSLGVWAGNFRVSQSRKSWGNFAGDSSGGKRHNRMIIIFCGVPGSGKTTIAEILAGILGKFGRVKLVVSDEIPARVYKRIFKVLKTNLDETDYILVDATFYKRSWREMTETIGGKGHVLTCYLHCSLETCLARNRERDPSVPERVIYIISQEMEPPSHPFISIDTEKTTPEEAAFKIAERIRPTREGL
jgi:tRNA uridine 5-carbamoylmethylation protein Kti12